MGAQPKDSGEKLIATNPNARRNFFIDEVFEAGLVLTGTEVKSLRAQAPNLKDAYVEIRGSAGQLEAWLLNCHIPPYSHGNIWNHDPMRKRKLLMSRHEIDKLHGAITQKGQTLVCIRMYFTKGRAKAELGLGKGKKHGDKRADLKKKEAQREMERGMKARKG